ncbi:hypothetical protein ACFPN0_11115 [Kitasatospora cinereorecta]
MPREGPVRALQARPRRRTPAPLRTSPDASPSAVRTRFQGRQKLTLDWAFP